jgi:hypothetical protein
VSRVPRSTCLFALAALAPSCSLFVTGPDPRTPPEEPPRCTSSLAAPVVDTVAAAGFAALSALFLFATLADECDSRNGTCNDNEGTGFVITGVLAVPAVLYGGAAHRGFSKTAACRRAIDTHRRWLADQPDLASPAAPLDAPPARR